MNQKQWISLCVVLLTVLSTATESDACSPYDAGVIELMWVTDQAQDVYLNTNIWLRVQEEGSAADIQVLGPEGVVSVSITRYQNSGYHFGQAHYIIAPVQPLAPETTYTISTNIAAYEGQRSESYTFTTGRETRSAPEPDLSTIKHFNYSYPTEAEECTPNEYNNIHFIFPQEHTDGILLYHVELFRFDDPVDAEPYERRFFSSQHLVNNNSLTIHDLIEQSGDFSCVRLTAEDQQGQKTTSARLCHPEGCRQGERDYPYALFNPAVWSSAPECPPRPVAGAPEEEQGSPGPSSPMEGPVLCRDDPACASAQDDREASGCSSIPWEPRWRSGALSLVRVALGALGARR